MRASAAAFSITLVVSSLAWGQTPQNSGTDVQLRGISAVSGKVAWASGAGGTVLRTVDGGATWQKVEIVGSANPDFRDIQAFDQNTAYVLSIGPGDQSRIYKTSDGGRIWQMQFTNKDPKAFYDCFAFWDSTHGIALSDSVDGKFPLIATTDGASWNPVAVRKMPVALPNEGAFAASGTCIATYGKNDVWFGTGGPAARVFHSSDRGQTWTVAETPIIHGAATQGVFSLVFATAKDGVAVGGDYKEPEQAEKVAAFTHDGGKTWTLAKHQPSGYRSGAALAPVAGPSIFVAVGTSGADQAHNGGESWQTLDHRNYNAISFAGPDAGWAVGPSGLIVRFPAFVPARLSAHQMARNRSRQLPILLLIAIALFVTLKHYLNRPPPFTCGIHCGTERWRIKTVFDNGAKRINFTRGIPAFLSWSRCAPPRSWMTNARTRRSRCTPWKPCCLGGKRRPASMATTISTWCWPIPMTSAAP